MDQSTSAQSWVDDVGRWIHVLVVGQPTGDMIRSVNEQVLALVQAGRGPRVLLDARQMLSPPSQVAWLQRDMIGRLQPFVRCAVVVADARIAFLVRIAFGEANYKVFYDDLDGATRWLERE